MRHFLKFTLSLLIVLVISNRASASHGMALVNPSFTVGTTGLTFTASSNAATCGGGPYWLQVELRCTAGQLTGTPPASMQTNLLNWTGPGNTYNNVPGTTKELGAVHGPTLLVPLTHSRAEK